jgi:hypothetical protein
MALNPQKSIDQFKKLIETYKAQDAENLYVLIDAQMKTKPLCTESAEI